MSDFNPLSEDISAVFDYCYETCSPIPEYKSPIPLYASEFDIEDIFRMENLYEFNIFEVENDDLVKAKLLRPTDASEKESISENEIDTLTLSHAKSSKKTSTPLQVVTHEESEEKSKALRPKITLILQKKNSRYFLKKPPQNKGPNSPQVAGQSTLPHQFSLSGPLFTLKNLIKRIKHTRKARRGDGDDLTPNVTKLYNINLDIEKIKSAIKDLVPANELLLDARSKFRKEKNKLASRATRLKRKARYEANKLKLFGLQEEEKNLLGIIKKVKKVIKKNIHHKLKQGKPQSNVHAKVEAICMKKCYTQVAGCSAEFVKKVLKSVGQGDQLGGLNEH